MTDLKPCPFCGIEVTRTDSDGKEWGDVFFCRGCGTEFGIAMHANSAVLDRFNNSAVKLWNTRAMPRLPLVKPEDLVIGETYKAVFADGNHHTKDAVLAECGTSMWGPDLEQCEPFKVMWIVGSSIPFQVSCFKAIYGPLPEFKLEEKIKDNTTK